MKIAVCIKQVPASTRVQLDPFTKTIVRGKGEAILNPFDAFAVEEAVRLKERYGATVTALSMGIPAATSILKEAMAMGVDAGLLLSDKKFAGADTLATAYTLMHGIHALGRIDLILCGKQATDGDTAQVPPILSYNLNFSCLTDVCEILEVSANAVTCRRMSDEGYAIWEAKLPALISVTKEINVPRLPSLQGLRYSHSQAVRVLTASDFNGLDDSKIGLSGSPTQVKETFIPERTVEVRMLEGDASEQSAILHDVFIQRNLL